MNVIISAGGRFHAYQLAQQLAQRNSLRNLYTFSHRAKDQSTFDTRLIKNYRLCSWLDWAYFNLRINKFISPSRYNTNKDILFDHWVSKQLKKEEPFDLFVGWANYATKSIPIARKLGAKIIVESGSCHIAAQQKLLQQEYQTHGLMHQPITQRNRERMIQEYHAADYIMTLSSFARKSFIDHGFAPEKILQVACGADIEYFMTPKQETLVKQQVFTVMFVGLLSIRKGIHYLIDAWQQLKLPEATTRLLLVGSMQHDLQQVLKNKTLTKNIVFYGPTSRETLRKLYQQASVFVLPSVEDGFGMVMGEAMASGLPIISTINTGAPDVITDGKEGFLVPAQQASGLAEKIAWCYEHQDQATQMGLQGQKTIQNYRWDIYGERVYEVYRNIVNKK